MDICEEQVVTACGLCLLSEEGKLVKRKYWILHVPYAVALRRPFQNGIVVARHGTRESNTASLCKSNGRDTI